MLLPIKNIICVWCSFRKNLSLKYFVLQSQSRKQYREYIRCARLLIHAQDKNAYNEVMTQVRYNIFKIIDCFGLILVIFKGA